MSSESTKKRSRYRKIVEVPIHFVSVVTLYDAEPDNSNSFSMSLNFSSTPEVKIAKRVKNSGERATEKEYKKQG